MIVALLCAIAGIALFVIGFIAGSRQREIGERLEALEQRRYDHEIEDQPGSAIIDTSPKAIRQREAAVITSEDESDAQLIHTKSPRQMRADRERRDEEELDKLTNGAIR